MPHAVGHIAAPSITTLACRNVNSSKRDLRNGGRHVITANTYVKLDTVTPGCVLYFTTDGLTPDPNNRVIDGFEKTFKYKGPFKLRSGTRVVRALALCRANHRQSQESKRVFEVVEANDETNETLSEVSSSTANTNSDDFFDFPSEPSAYRPGNLADGSLLYQKNLEDYSRFRRRQTDSEADWSSTVSDVYTDMTPPRLDGFDAGQRLNQRTSLSASNEPLLDSCFDDSHQNHHRLAGDISDRETEVSNYFRKSQRPDYSPSRNRLSFDTPRSGLRDYTPLRTPTPRVRFEMDEAYRPSSEAIYHHNGRDDFQVGYRSSRSAARSTSSTGWNGPLLTEDESRWNGGLHDPRSARSDGALPRHVWNAETRFEPYQQTEWVAGHGHRGSDPRVHDPWVKGQPKSEFYKDEDAWREETLKKKNLVEGTESQSSSSSSSSSNSSSSSSSSSTSSGDSEDKRGDDPSRKGAGKKDAHLKKDDEVTKIEKTKREKDQEEKDSGTKFKEAKKGDKERKREKEKVEQKKGEKSHEEKKKGELGNNEEKKDLRYKEKKGEKEEIKKEKKKAGEKKNFQEKREDKEMKEEMGKKKKLKEEKETKDKVEEKEDKKNHDEKDKKSKDKEIVEMKKDTKNAELPGKNVRIRAREEMSDGDSDTDRESTAKSLAKSHKSRDGSLRFINDSGTQINLWGVSPDDVMETLSTVLPPGNGRHVNHSQASDFAQPFKQPIQKTRNTVVAKQPSGKLPSPSSSIVPPVARIQQQEQQTIFSSAKKFFKGWGKPEKVPEKRTTVRVINGALDSKRGYADIRKTCLAEGRLWEDPDFPAEEGSLYYRKPATTEKIVWKRPSDLCASPHLFVGGASRFDVVQGLLGDCWLLAAVASLTSDEKLLHRVVPHDQSFDQDYAGIFHCCLWRYGTWLDVCIDDRLPTVNGKLVFMHSQQKNEFWSALLEKAYAKLCGSYEALTGGLASEAMTDFTGGIVERFNFREELPDDMLQILLKAYERHSLMSCSVDPESGQVEDKLENGLIIGHAYSITSVKMVSLSGNQKVGLVRVRNPWGNQYEWKGAWSDQSAEWNQLTAEQKKSIDLVFDHDGEFWMSFRDFSTYFHHVEICNLGPDELASTRDDRITWLSSIQEGVWKKNTNAGGCRNYPESFWINPQYRIQITDADDDDEEELGTVVVGLLQKGGRRRRIEGQSQLTIGYDIYQIADHEQETMTKDYFLSKAPVAMVPSYSDMREVCGRHRLPPGNYVVVPTTYDPNEEADFILRIFTEKEAKMTEVNEATSVTKPEALGIYRSVGADAEFLTEAEQKFAEHSGDDGSIDAFELQKILNDVFKKDFDFGEFDLNLCRSLVAMNDVNQSGLLDLEEFKRLWMDLQSWKTIYLQFDQDNSRHFNSVELREALSSVGFKLSNGTLSTIVTRCCNREGQVHFDDFVFAIARLRTMFDAFHSQCQSSDPLSKANFTLDEFIQLTFYS